MNLVRFSCDHVHHEALITEEPDAMPTGIQVTDALQRVCHVGDLRGDATNCLLLRPNWQDLLPEVRDLIAVCHTVLIAVAAANGFLNVVQFPNSWLENWH